jgi:hypothetical protein
MTALNSSQSHCIYFIFDMCGLRPLLIQKWGRNVKNAVNMKQKKIRQLERLFVQIAELFLKRIKVHQSLKLASYNIFSRIVNSIYRKRRWLKYNRNFPFCRWIK